MVGAQGTPRVPPWALHSSAMSVGSRESLAIYRGSPAPERSAQRTPPGAPTAAHAAPARRMGKAGPGVQGAPSWTTTARPWVSRRRVEPLGVPAFHFPMNYTDLYRLHPAHRPRARLQRIHQRTGHMWRNRAAGVWCCHRGVGVGWSMALRSACWSQGVRYVGPGSSLCGPTRSASCGSAPRSP